MPIQPLHSPSTAVFRCHCALVSTKHKLRGPFVLPIYRYSPYAHLQANTSSTFGVGQQRLPSRGLSRHGMRPSSGTDNLVVFEFCSCVCFLRSSVFIVCGPSNSQPLVHDIKSLCYIIFAVSGPSPRLARPYSVLIFSKLIYTEPSLFTYLISF